jgi:hypothetical protein
MSKMDGRDLLGGSVVSVVIRLALLSLVVGIVLSALGISPANILYHLDVLMRRVYDMGFGAIEWVFRYILLGAVVVVPIWLIARLVRSIGGGTSRRE